MKRISRGDVRGLVFVILLGLIAYLAAPYIPGLNAILLGLLAGILLSNFLKLPASFYPGIGWGASSLLEISIVLLGFGINYATLAQAGTGPLIIVVVTVLLIAIGGSVLSKWVKCPGKTGLLVSFGTAICGSAAIAAASPGLKADKADTGIALAVVNLLGAVGMLIMPAILAPLDWHADQAGLLLGGTLHAVGNVAGAGFALGDEVGAFSLTIKMARVALLSPVLLLFLWWNGRQAKDRVWQFPLYLVLFIAATIVASMGWVPASLEAPISIAGKLTLTIAMTAIGLRISLRALYSSGKAALLFGVLIFSLQILLVLGLISFL